MASGPRESVQRDLDRVFRQGTVAGLEEGQLLRRFVTCRDGVAFEALVARHGPMVLGVCRRKLGDPHEVADAFQATFLVLIRKAGTLRDADQLGPWLHGVAFRIATRARSDSSRRREREQRGRGPRRWKATPSRTGSACAGSLTRRSTGSRSRTAGRSSSATWRG